MLVSFWKIQHMSENRSYIQFSFSSNILFFIKHSINLTHIVFIVECHLALAMSILSFYNFINLKLHILFRKSLIDNILDWDLFVLLGSFAWKSSNFKILYFTTSNNPIKNLFFINFSVKLLSKYHIRLLLNMCLLSS